MTTVSGGLQCKRGLVRKKKLKKKLKKIKRAFAERIAQGGRFASRAEHAGYSSSPMVLATFRRNTPTCVCVCLCALIYTYSKCQRTQTHTFCRGFLPPASLREGGTIRQERELGSCLQGVSLLLLLLIVILVMTVGDLLRSHGEQVGRLDLAEGAGQVVAFALQVRAVVAVGAVPCGQRRLQVDVNVGVLNRRLVRHLRRRRKAFSGGQRRDTSVVCRREGLTSTCAALNR